MGQQTSHLAAPGSFLSEHLPGAAPRPYQALAREGENPIRLLVGHAYVKRAKEWLIMETVEKTIEIEAPVTEVYRQWTQFGEFSEFMEGVEEVTPLDDKHFHWVAEIAGRKKEWDTDIIEQAPGERLAWRSTTGAPNQNRLSFRAVDDRTLVTWQVNYEPEGVVEKVASTADVLSRRVEGDLKRFLDFFRQRLSEKGVRREKLPPERREAA